jgi:membrane protein YqaA with SNARE-associated domain
MHKVVLWIQIVLVPMLGPAGIFVIAFLDSSFISVPEINDILVVTSSSAHPERAWLYALMATLGSVTGCLVLWELGRRGGEAFLVRRFGASRVERTRAAFQRWDVLAIAIPSLLPPPMPFKIFVLSAGVFGFSGRRLALTLVIARGMRYTLWAILGAVYGDEALGWLERTDRWFADRWPYLLLITAGALLVLALVLAARKALRARAGAGQA